MPAQHTKYFNYKLCKQCKGQCCKGMAGAFSPNDFNHKITVDFILSLLHSEKVAIDTWIGDADDKDILDYTYFLRPRHINEPAIYDSWGGKCINLTDEGCSLSENERPYQCRMLVPKPDYKCATIEKDKANKKEMARRWYPYQKIIDQARKNFDI